MGIGFHPSKGHAGLVIDGPMNSGGMGGLCWGESWCLLLGASVLSKPVTGIEMFMTRCSKHLLLDTLRDRS